MLESPTPKGFVAVTDRARRLAQTAALAAADKLAQDVVAIDVSERLPLTDAFVIASAPNERQVQAVVDNVEEKLRDLEAKPVRREGTQEARWVLLDFGDIVVHVMHTDERDFYGLERLWKDCPAVPLPAEVYGPPSDRSAAVE
ncbi:ribosome silencing factor [Actinomycetospora chlora]|uniref:Ribosomal silencing factor RsfS n=1 Tax=Actinomycetospora chlora TaxID=663608 RepID=A0ABP9AGG5_9PSEU